MRKKITVNTAITSRGTYIVTLNWYGKAEYPTLRRARKRARRIAKIFDTEYEEI